jgi:small subunit ribosomal protein S8
MTIIANLSSNLYNNQQKYKHFLKCSVSKITIEIATILFKENFIRGFFLKKINKKVYLYIILKYGGLKKFTKIFAIPKIMPSKKVNKISKYKNGLGLYIISTPKGLMTNSKATKLNLGGVFVMNIF